MKNSFDTNLLISKAWEVSDEIMGFILADKKRLDDASKIRKDYAHFNKSVISAFASDEVLEQVKRTNKSDVIAFETTEYIVDKDGNYVNGCAFNKDNAEPLVCRWEVNISTFEAIQEDPECEGLYHYQPLSKDAVMDLTSIFEAWMTSVVSFKK